MKNFPVTFSLALLVILLAPGCESKDDDDCQGTRASVSAGVEGCTTLDVVDSSTTFEPVNLNEFEIDLQLGQTVCLTYVDFNGASTCQAGQLITIQTIEIIE